MNPLARCLVPAASALALAGCAAITVDVDVYKGPLIDPERMRTEQLAAMAMGAKPLLLQLRAHFETECDKFANPPSEYSRRDFEMALERRCEGRGATQDDWNKRKKDCQAQYDTGEAVPEPCLRSWQGRRVNATLTLYRSSAASLGRSRGDLEKLLARLETATEEIREFLKRATGMETDPVGPRAIAILSDRYAETIRGHLRSLTTESKNKEVRSTADAVLKSDPKTGRPDGFNAAEIHKLQSEVLGRLKIGRPDTDLGKMRNAVRSAWTGSLELLKDREFRRTAGHENVELVAGVAATLTGYMLLADYAAKRGEFKHDIDVRPIPPLLLERPTGSSEDREKRINALVGALATNDRGLQLAAVLLALNSAIEKDPSTSDPSNPKDLLARPGLVPLLGHVQRVKDALAESVATSLERGRRQAGVERLIEEYHAAEDAYLRDRSAANRAKARERRLRLLHSLTDFAQKVVYMANYEVLLPGSDRSAGAARWRDPIGALLGDYSGSSTEQVRLLQAIGNSLMNQISDYKRWDLDNERQVGDRIIRDAAHRNAAAAAGRESLDSLSAELGRELGAQEAKPILDNLRKGAESARSAAEELERRRKAAAASVAELQRTLKAGAETKSLLEDPKLRDAAIKAAEGQKPPGVRTKVSVRVISELQNAATQLVIKGDREGAARRQEAMKRVKEFAGTPAYKNAATGSEAFDALLVAADDVMKRYEGSLKDKTGLLDRLKRWSGMANSVASFDAGLAHPPMEAGQWRDSKQVMDWLIASLQHLNILEERAGLADRAAQTKQALHTAQTYRSGMVFIRPAAVFLRDSYPATILQSATNTDRSLLRLSSPFPGSEQSAAEKTQEVIDKQFWQTINHISLSGAGQVNYVLTKDDIGNWYVKGYSADPKEIYESARSLMSFAVSAKYQAEALLGRGGSTLSQGSLYTSSPNDRSLLARQLASASGIYDSEVRSALHAVRKSACQYKADIATASTGASSASKVKDVDEDKALAALCIAGGKRQDDEALAPMGDMKRADALKEALSLAEAMRRQRKAMRAAVDTSGTDAGKAEFEAIEKAANPPIQRLVSALESTMNRFEGRMRFALDTASDVRTAP